MLAEGEGNDSGAARRVQHCTIGRHPWQAVARLSNRGINKIDPRPYWRVTTSRLARLACILLGVLCAACKADELVVEYREVEHRFSVAERRAIERITRGTIAEVRQLLTALPERIALRVDADDNVGAMTNAAATAVAPDRIYWSVDPNRGGGVLATAEVHLRAMLFHELHHLVREAAIPRVSLMDHVITEGMASAFERDYAGARYPFSNYPDNVAAWVAELAILPGSADLNQWMYRHPDGRRWIGFRAGTYLVDQAMAASGRSSGDLAATPTARVLEMADVEPAGP